MRIRHLVCIALAIPSLIYGASFTVSKSMVGSSGSFTTAGITDPAYTYSMTGTIVAGFTMNITTNIVLLFNGGLTNQFCGGFIFKNGDASNSVNLFLDSAGTRTSAVIQAGHSVAIDGAPARMWVNTPTNTVLASWAFTDL